MTTAIIITICLLLLLAYLFDVSSSKTKIPSVILLLLLGWGVKQGAIFFDIFIPNLTPILPILGTVGLILIVLEGSLELELNKSKLSIVGKSSLMAILQMLLICFGLTFAFYYFGGSEFKTGLINAIPLAIISSAIAIPSARNLISQNKEFITYESSLSDIFGVIFFNFVILNDNLNAVTIGVFLLQIFLMIVVSFVSTLGLAFLLSKIKHHIKFTPIEMTFMIRALFFLLFGYLIETSELLNADTFIWSVIIVSGIFLIRFMFLKIVRLPTSPLLYIAPRGLITILLFLSIPLGLNLDIANQSLILQVIILSAIVMMVGLMKHKNIE